MKLQIKSTQNNKRNLSAPEKIYATIGGSGEINLQWDSVSKAKQYVIQFATKEKRKWKQADIISSAAFTFTNLKPGIKYLFRVAAVLKEGQSTWSRVISRKAK